MRFATFSNYYLIDWWSDIDFCLHARWIDFKFYYSYLTWETGWLELASTIILVLQANRLTKCGISSMLHDFDLEAASNPARKEEVEELGYCGADIVTWLC